MDGTSVRTQDKVYGHKMPRWMRRKYNLPEHGQLGIPHEQIRAIFQKEGRLANEKGREAEDKFVKAWSNYRDYPGWLKHVRRATREEDYQQQTDAVMIGKNGEFIRIQIKCIKRLSFRRFKSFSKKGIVLLRIWPWDKPAKIREKTLTAIERHEHYVVSRLRRQNKRAVSSRENVSSAMLSS